MHPFNRPISELVLADIQTLIDNGVPEGRTLDYKRDLYGGGDAEKKECLCDVSAFANTVGGYLIIGVDEEDRIPKRITPVRIENVDTEQQRFENLLRTAVDPPIRGVEFQAIDAGDGKYILVIEIPRSLSRPHAVNHKGHWRFYGRNSIGKYPYEVDDVRKAMLHSETLALRIRNFRNDRLAQISVGETPIPLIDGAKTVLHLMPLSSFELGQRYDLSRLSNADLPTLCVRDPNRRLNFDGVVTYLADDKTGNAENYTQMFHNGIVEAVDIDLLQKGTEAKIIPSQAYEQYLIRALNQYMSSYHKLDVAFPIWIGLSLLGVKDYYMGVAQHPWTYETHPIDRDELILPEIQVEDTSIPAEQILKPAFDSIWNACGYERSRNYEENGNWQLQGR